MYYCKTTLSFYMSTYFISSQILYAYSYKSEKHLENVFYNLIVICRLKMGSKVIKCNNRSIFTNCVSFFSLDQQQDIFYTLKRVEVLQKA